MLTTASLKEN